MNHGPLLNERYAQALDTVLDGKPAPLPASEFAHLSFALECELRGVRAALDPDHVYAAVLGDRGSRISVNVCRGGTEPHQIRVSFGTAPDDVEAS